MSEDQDARRAAFAKWWMDGRKIPAEYRHEFGCNLPGRLPRIAVICDPKDCEYAECTGFRMEAIDEDISQ